MKDRFSQYQKSKIWVATLSLILAVHAGIGSSRGNQSGAPRSDLEVMRGVVRAATQAVLFSQIQGRIIRLPYKEGERFKKGASLVQIDCDKYKAELLSAIAEHEAKEKTHQNNLGLAKLNAVSKLDPEISAAEVKKAAAAIRIAEVYVRGCRITAPFSGRVVEVMVHEHENVFPNDKLLSLLDDTSLEIELVLPSKSLAWLKRDTSFTFTVDETGRQYEARVKEVGANVDPSSQTIKAIGIFKTLPQEVLAGMSGTASFSNSQH